MKDVMTLLAAGEGLRASGEEGVLVTLVRTVGSTYRRAGARMLVLPGCRTVGTISGGCLESAVAREAWAATRGAERAVMEVESAPEDDLWGPASGCHGRLYLMAERIGGGARCAALEALAGVRAGQRAVVFPHYFSVKAGGRMEAMGDVASEVWEKETAVTLANAASRWVEREGVAAFLEYMGPPVHLVICGAGEDAVPLARMAGELAWRIDVVDTRGRLASQERFAMAGSVGQESGAGVVKLVHRHSAVVLMTHRFADDLDYLGALMGMAEGPAFVGVLGPRRRMERLLEELASRGVVLGAKQLQALRSPVGLDLGSSSPETIALAIVAEIQGVMTGRDGHSLSQRAGAIQMGSVKV